MSDGLLKDIRMAQFKAGRTRVVLDLDQVSKFEASLLSNPPRLIIDIRNTDIRNTDIQSKDDQDTHNQIAHDQRAARALLKQAASSTEITDEKTPQTGPHRIRWTTLTNLLQPQRRQLRNRSAATPWWSVTASKRPSLTRTMISLQQRSPQYPQ